MKKYILPSVEVINVETQQMLAISVVVDPATGIIPENADAPEFLDFENELFGM